MAFERVEPFCEKIAELPKERVTLLVKSVSSSNSPDGYSVDGLSSPNRSRGEPKVSAVRDNTREPSPETRSSELPVCGNCEGPLSFPFWYCIFCEGQSPGVIRVTGGILTSIILRYQIISSYATHAIWKVSLT